MTFERLFLTDPAAQADKVRWPPGQAALQWWIETYKTGRLPSIAQFKPARHATALPSTVTYTLNEDGEYIMSLVGTLAANLFGEDPTGQLVRTLRGGPAIVAAFDEFIRCKVPIIQTNTPMFWAEKDHRRYDVLILPCANDGVSVDTLIAIHHFKDV